LRILLEGLIGSLIPVVRRLSYHCRLFHSPAREAVPILLDSPCSAYSWAKSQYPRNGKRQEWTRIRCAFMDQPLTQGHDCLQLGKSAAKRHYTGPARYSAPHFDPWRCVAIQAGPSESTIGGAGAPFESALSPCTVCFGRSSTARLPTVRSSRTAFAHAQARPA